MNHACMSEFMDSGQAEPYEQAGAEDRITNAGQAGTQQMTYGQGAILLLTVYETKKAEEK